ncbi:MAG TPA: hypothetical protein VEJ63_01280 [Planctomycetota bacterium]|nr:hypothetical protein [Planctomycetota bacterium]
MRSLCILILIALAPLPCRAEDPKPIPELKLWEANMLKFGEHYKDQKALGIVPEYGTYYYDGEWVYFQIYDYTKDPKWLPWSQSCEEVYRTHIFEEKGMLPGHRVHPHGLYEDFKRNKDEKSREALMLLAKHSHWAPGRPGNGGVKDFGACRENAYILMAMVLAEDLGEKMPKIEHAVECGLFCLDEFSTKKATWIMPFMAGLQAEALILYAEKKNAAARVLPVLSRFADWLWDECWVEKDQAFCYRREEPNNPATKPTEGTCDLNLLIAHMYAWLYKQTGEPRFRDRGDKVFAGGVKNTWLDRPGGKIFSQNYRSSFNYVRWRREGPSGGAKAAAAPKSSGAEFTGGKKKAETPAAASPGAESSASTPPATAPENTSEAKPQEAKPAPVAAIDPAPIRASLEEHLRKNGKPKKNEKVLIQSLKQEVPLASINEKGVNIVVQGNEMPLRWKDLKDEDLIRIASAHCDDAEGLYLGGVLAAALKMPTVRDKFMERLGDIDPKKANELAKTR